MTEASSGKIPTTSVPRAMSRLNRSSGLVLRSLGQCSAGVPYACCRSRRGVRPGRSPCPRRYRCGSRACPGAPRRPAPRARARAPRSRARSCRRAPARRRRRCRPAPVWVAARLADVDQRGRLRAVLLAGRRHLDRADQRLGRVRRRRTELVAVKALVLALAPVAHLGIDGRDDPVGARATIKPRDAIGVDVEVLADQLAQQTVRLLDALVVEQPVRALDRPQRTLGVLRHAGEHPLTLGLLAPATVRLVVRALVVELQTVSQPAGPLAINIGERIDQLAHPVANQPDRVLGGRRPSIGMESMICSAGPSSIPSSSATTSVFSSATRSLPCNNSRARNLVSDVGCQPT